ncbi:hypothetical protein CWM47_16370 [Spirosoma pollinicola]|uniref:Uncharacterized protein n=2 Tax=Spirosoma pollinicola TaxID=2057025 RepID=A0A2K8Z050_9BACT|nr:hypothetical protein CWM47_16370 [Spirosoma pollinicola]
MAVAHRRPSPSVYSELLASIVKRKNDKIVEYCKGLDHVNLIVADMEEPFSYTDDKELYKYLFDPALKKIITSTKFNEVFLITRVKKNRKVFIPLRMLLVLGQIFLFDWAIGEFYPSLTYESPDARLRFFAEFLITIGHRITLRTTEKGLAIKVGLYLIRAIPGEGTTVLDYLDISMQNKIVPIEKSEHSDKLNNAFMTFYEDYTQKGIFIASVAFEVTLDQVDIK